MFRLLWTGVAVMMLQAQTAPEYGIAQTLPGVHVIQGATVVTSPGKSLKNTTILIRDGRIAAVGSNVRVPADAIVHDLTGKIIYPGFIDIYSEYGLEKRKRQPGFKFDAERTGGRAWNAAIHAQVNHADLFKPDAKAAKAMRKFGFTTVHSALKDGIFRGRGVIAMLADGNPNDVMFANSGLHGLSFNKGTSNQQYPGSLMGSIALIRQTFMDAEWYAKAQAAYQQNPRQTKPEYNAALAALRTIKRETVLFDAETPLGVFRADRVLDEAKVKGIIISPGRVYDRIADVKKLQADLVLDLSFPKAPNVSSPFAAVHTSLGELRRWERGPSNPAAVEEAGIRFALTSHGVKNDSEFWKNLRTAINYGLSETAALTALTTRPAQMLGINNLVGTISTGKFANLIVADKSLFNDDGKILDVWVAGQKYSVSDYAKNDHRGMYDVTMDGKTYKLTLKGTPEKLSGHLAASGKETKLEKLMRSDDKLTFQVRLDSLGTPGYYFVQINRVKDVYSGYISDASQLISTLTITRTGDAEMKTDKKKKDKPLQILSSMTFPNRAYGRSGLPRAESVIFKNATLWTSEKEGILENADIWIERGKIKRIGKNLSGGSRTTVIDATGKHISAGIIDEHVHFGADAINEWTESSSAEVRIGDVVNPEDINIYRHLGFGVTTAQILHGSANPIGGQSQVIKLRWGMDAEGLKYRQAAPNIKFALGENVKRSRSSNNQRYPDTRMGVAAFFNDMFNRAKAYEADWKRYNNLSSRQKRRTVPPRKDLDLDAILAVRNSKLFVHCHSYVASEILALMQVAEKHGFRVHTFTHILEGYKVAAEMAKHGAMGSTFSDWWAYKWEVYDAIPFNTTIMHSKGVVTSVNTDIGSAAMRLNHEAAKSYMYGRMSKEEAWKLITINPAKQLQVEKFTGSLKVGKDADIVVWSGDPLSIYSFAEQTWVDGRKYYDIVDHQQQVKDIEEEKQKLIRKIKDGKYPTKAAVTPMKQFYHDCEEETSYQYMLQLRKED